ncbi:hypothetical protein VTH06DRAFT_334 [Thermothelomyces fergusii]
MERPTMPAVWEGIPFIGPVLGPVADGILNRAIQVGEQAGGVASGVADAVIGKKRVQKLATVLPASLVNKFADKNQLIDTTTETVKDADDGPLARLSTQVLRRWRPIQDGAAKMVETAKEEEVESILQSLWGLAISVTEKVRPGKLLKALPELRQLMLEKAFGAIRVGIFHNEINVATLGLLWNHFVDLVKFSVGLVECAKCYAPASSLDGKAEPGDPHGSYNELYLAQPMNRHAIICQLQRLALSTVFILERAATPARFEEIDMTRETMLPTDDCDLGTLMEVRPSGWQCVVEPGMPRRAWTRLPALLPPGPGGGEAVGGRSFGEGARPGAEMPCPGAKPPDKSPQVTREKWFFVNGIATELFWLHIACEKLAERYSREVTGVFNRSEGILWDLIECAGERDAWGVGSTSSQKAAVERTRSSRIAREKLKEQLKAALRQAGEGKEGQAYDHVVVIAHSQGCLLLRLALEELILRAAKYPGSAENIRRPMLDRLCVFTFGNPSVDWRLQQDQDGSFPAALKGTRQERSGTNLAFLSSHVLCTEHFANTSDFVAKLGVLSKHKDRHNSGYESDSVFVNCEEGWVGHLFGTQYSLEPRHYEAEGGPGEESGKADQTAGFRSVLLNCQGGTPIREAMRRKANVGQQLEEAV